MTNARESSHPEPRAARLQSLSFYLLIPLANAFLFGWMRAGRTALWPRESSLLYWIGNIFIFWLLSDLLARVLALLQGRHRMPLWLLLLLSNVGVGFLAKPLVSGWFALLLPLLPADAHIVPPQPFQFATWLAGTLPGAAIWVGVNLLLFHAFRMPRYGYLPPVSSMQAASTAVNSDAASAAGQAAVADAAQAQPAFMEKVRQPRRGKLLALKAEGHYLKVYTSNGEDLVLYRFSHALAEVSALSGGQVHRSWWVAQDAVRSNAGPEKLVLHSGLEVPVSRSFRVVARRDGLLRSVTEAS